jgi:arsenate reductase
MKRRVLIVCTGNSARSQMAEGLFRELSEGRYDVFSAGTRPSLVRPEAIAVLRELGIDISSHRSKSVDEFAGQAFDLVVTVCDNAREACPVFPGGGRRLHWPFPDPAEEKGPEAARLAAFRAVRDQIRERIAAFLASERD